MWAALVGVWLVVALDITAFWGVLILVWVVPSLVTGSIVFVDVVDRRESPVLYWLIEATWIACGLHLVWLDIAWWQSVPGGGW